MRHLSHDEKTGIAFLDISTGEFFVAEGDMEYATNYCKVLSLAK